MVLMAYYIVANFVQCDFRHESLFKEYIANASPISCFLGFWLQIAIESFALFHHSDCDYVFHWHASVMR